MLLRQEYLDITNAFGLLRLLPGGDRDKDIEILALRSGSTLHAEHAVSQSLRQALKLVLTQSAQIELHLCIIPRLMDKVTNGSHRISDAVDLAVRRVAHGLLRDSWRLPAVAGPAVPWGASAMM